MTIGSGIGGGVVIRQEIYHGAYPGEVEIGHLRLNKKGDTLESKCSGWAVDKRIREAVAAQPGSILAGLAKGAGKGEARFLKQALQGRDPIAQEIIAETADDIAFALSHVVHLFHPEIVVIGGGLSLLGDDLINAVTARLPNYLMSAFLPGPLVRVASLGQNVVPIGALALAKAAPLQ
jgi:glucokinase